ncbi:MAG TPA: ankyrin repeat domain-containing protein, partial [Verrucomicrobiae bacterium]|nr:ankyrin repeat domain-containing protein [Verrucomicrobiae bacterium]
MQESIHEAFCKNDVASVCAALTANPQLKQLINAPIGAFDSPAICHVRSREMLDLLLENGANINAKSQWWAGGFGLLDFASDDLAQYAIQRGARIEAHSAARLGMLDKLRELITANATLVNARGGDGKQPLHFARNIEVAKFLLDHGADIDAKDIDHESTPAQHLIGDHAEVARYLVERGAKTDLFLAAALGDLTLVQKHLAENPDLIRARIDSKTFPMSNPRAGGTIYIWTLGNGLTPHQVAKKFGHAEIVKYLFEQSPPEIQLLNHIWLGDEPAAKRLLAEHPNLASEVAAMDPAALPNAARERNQFALRLFLEAGFPIDARGQHNATALHWSAWHGHAESVELLLQHKAPLELKDADFQATPIGWAM